jgi:hypothetical protein
MSGVQANWFTEGLELPGGDPMEAIAQLKSRATVIDLSRGEAVLLDEFRVKFERERQFSASGLECRLKWTSQGGARNPCYSCPHFSKDFENVPRALLCRLGREQNDLLDAVDEIRAVGHLDAELASAVQREQSEADELAAALL